MARTHGRLQAVIWSDTDFIAMRVGAQRMFMFLLSQPDLSHAGLLPMRVNRWAKKASDLTPRGVREELDYLSERDFVVCDEDTEEVLIRTMVRNDGVYKQPKVMIRMREDARQIESPMLRCAFRGELERLPLDELSDRPGGPNADQPSTRAQVEAVVNTLRADFAQDTGYPSEGVSDTPHVRAGAFHLPPTTYPHPPSTIHQDKPSSDKSDTTEPDRFEEFWDTYGNKVGRKKCETAFAKAIKSGNDADTLIASAAAYADWCQRSDTFMKNPLTWLNGEHWNDERPARQQRPAEQHQGRASQWLQLAADLGPDQPTNVREIGPPR